MQSIDIKGLYFSYGKGYVLSNLNLRIQDKGVYSLIGKNGSGKTTLLKILIKFLHYEKGEIKINGKDLNAFTLKEIAQTVGFLESEIPHVYLPVEELISWGNFPFADERKNVEDVMKELNLAKIRKKSFQSLSTGEEKRVLLGRIFVQSPDIVLIDEPFNFLDPGYKIEVSLLLKRLGERSIVFIATHDIAAVQFVSKKVFVLHNGKIETEGSPDEVIKGKVIKKAFDISKSLEEKFKQFYHIEI